MSRKKKTTGGERRQLRLIDKNAPFDFSEAYKSLRTNVDYLASTNDYHSILVTSSGPWDGKSIVTLNLAISFANSGKRVILLDCDMRKASIAGYLKIGRSVPGVTSVLDRSHILQEVIIHDKERNIDVLPVGILPPNPAETVGSARMVQLVRLLCGMYDYVLIDTPPVSVVTDAAIMSRYVDGVILVARADETTKQALEMSKKRLEDVNANILGVVLNDFDARVHSYGSGYSYKYGYRYSDYGGYDRTSRGDEDDT